MGHGDNCVPEHLRRYIKEGGAPVKKLDKNYLILTFMEECAEAAQAASKVGRFGATGYDPNDPDKVTNQEQLFIEFNHVMAMMEMLMEYGIVSWFPYSGLAEKIRSNKKEKVTKLWKEA